MLRIELLDAHREREFNMKHSRKPISPKKNQCGTPAT